MMEQSLNNTSGRSSIGIPIPVTACSLAPSISLNYSSGSGNSAFGMGWALSLPEISRQTSLGIPKYDDSDIFLFGGDSMVSKLNSSGQAVATSKTIGSSRYSVMSYMSGSEDDFEIIERYSNNNDLSDVFWRVTIKKNIVSIYGKSDSAKIVDPVDKTRIFKWLLEESFDFKGNHALYRYKKENADNIPENLSEKNRDRETNSYLTQVNYGNNQVISDGSIVTGESATSASDVHWHFSIVFDYGSYDINLSNATPCDIPEGNTWGCRQDSFSSYSAGFEIRTYRLCQNIMLFHYFAEISQSGPVLNTVLQLSFIESPLISLMESVQHIDYQYDKTGMYKIQSLPSLDFGYTPFVHAKPDYVPHNYARFTDFDKQLLSQVSSSSGRLIDRHGEEGGGALVVPALKADTRLQIIRFTNMLGSGKAQRVRISNGMVECWPSLGNGKLSKAVKMDNAPNFGKDFDSLRLFLTDLDGSGMSDLVYISPNTIDIYLNQSGNAFAAKPIRIKLPETWDKLDQIRFADVRGNGTNCLITSQPHPDSQQWFYDFSLTTAENHAGNQETLSQKPYLLNKVDNNRGARTLIRYAASTKFFLEDKAAGLPWINRQSYPVSVIESISSHGDISKTSIVSSYRYHHA